MNISYWKNKNIDYIFYGSTKMIYQTLFLLKVCIKNIYNDI